VAHVCLSKPVQSDHMDRERKDAAQVSLHAIVLCLAPDSAQRFACDIPATCWAVSSRTARQIVGPLLFGGNRSVPNFSPFGKPSRPLANRMNTSGTWTLSTDEVVKLVLPQLLAASSREVRYYRPEKTRVKREGGLVCIRCVHVHTSDCCRYRSGCC
jgi:hypothetical protein